MDKQRLKLFIHGEPFAHQSVRSRIAKKKDGTEYIHHYQPKDIEVSKDNLRVQIMQLLPEGFRPFTGKVVINKLQYFFPPTGSMLKMKYIEAFFAEFPHGVIENPLGNQRQSYFKHGFYKIGKTTKPDLQDNLNKAVFDAMQGIVFINDSQIGEIQFAEKLYSLVPQTVIDLTGYYSTKQFHLEETHET